VRKFGALLAVVALAACSSGAKQAAPTTRPTFFGDPILAATKAYEDASPHSRRVLIVGDSVAYYLAEPMRAIHTVPPLAVLNLGFSGCNMLPGVSRDRSTRSNGQVVVAPTYPCDPDWEVGALARFRPAVVFWVTSSPPDELWQRNRWISACSSLYAREFRAALSHEVARLGALGAKVVITTSAYPRFHLQGSDAVADCENTFRRQVAATTGAQLADLFEYICPHGKCRREEHGVVLRSDGLHYKDAGGRIVARWLIDQVR
jgi:hypothetical protein